MPTRLIEAHLTWLKGAGRSPATIEKRKRLLLHLHASLPHGIDHAHEDELAAYLGSYSQPWTHYTYDTHARGFYEWAVRRGALTLNPMAYIPKPRQGAKVPAEVEDWMIATAVDARPPYGRAILMASYAGLRCSEIARAHRDDLTGNRLRVHGKGGKVRVVPLADIILDAVGAERGPLLGIDTTGQRLTNGQREAWEAAGLPAHFHLHCGRHWFATKLLESGALITEVQRILGHSSLATTQIYLRVKDDRLAAAVSRLPVMRRAEPVAARLGPSPAA